jgi:hypothetical protein
LGLQEECFVRLGKQSNRQGEKRKCSTLRLQFSRAAPQNPAPYTSTEVGNTSQYSRSCDTPSKVAETMCTQQCMHAQPASVHEAEAAQHICLNNLPKPQSSAPLTRGARARRRCAPAAAAAAAG